MAQQLIESLTTEFDPGQYRDEYRDAVLEMIERKAEGQEIEVPAPPDEEPEEVPDLMAALEASISGSKRQSKPKTKPKPKAKAEVLVLQRLEVQGQAEVQGQVDREEVGGGKAVEVDVEGRKLRLSNLEKVLYPEAGFTKGQVIDYYTRAAPVLLAHLRGRALTLKRYPNGVDDKLLLREAEALARARSGCSRCRSRAAARRPPGDRLRALRRPAHAGVAGQPGRPGAAPVAGAGRGPRRARPCWPSTSTRARRPALAECCEVALLLRDTLDHLGLECHAKTSGSKGMQVYVPLNSRRRPTTTPSRSPTGWPRLLEQRHDLIVSVDEEGAPQGQGLHRLEPERPPQDHGRAPTRCARASARRCPPRWRWDEVDHGAARRRGRPGVRGRATCSSGSRSTATCSPACSRREQELPDLSFVDGRLGPRPPDRALRRALGRRARPGRGPAGAGARARGAGGRAHGADAGRAGAAGGGGRPRRVGRGQPGHARPTCWTPSPSGWSTASTRPARSPARCARAPA